MFRVNSESIPDRLLLSNESRPPRQYFSSGTEINTSNSQTAERLGEPVFTVAHIAPSLGYTEHLANEKRQ